MKVVFFLFTLIFSSLAYSNESEYDDTIPEPLKPIIRAATAASDKAECVPRPIKLRHLCSSIDSMERESGNEPGIYFRYHRNIYEAACVDPAKDDEATIAKKISAVWNANQNLLECNTTKIDIVNANVIKFAALMRFDEFLYDVVKWKVDLNKVDDFDGRTPLDYIRDEKNRLQGTPPGVLLERYYNILRSGGAKHKSEL
jgi:hypothetical protein